MKQNNSFIGVFDSGLGGLSVLASMMRMLPDESFYYIADSAYCPYGNRTSEEVIARSVVITEYLLDRGAKMVVVACNTATAEAIDHLREVYAIPFVGIEPAIKQAAVHTSTGRVGVLATRNTIQGRLFRETSARFAAGKDIVIQVGEGLVELVEEGKTDTPIAEMLLRKYLDPMLESGVDQIVLGCTHYPFLIPAISKLVPEGIVIHDPSPAVARQASNILRKHGIEAPPGSSPYHKAASTGDPIRLKEMVTSLGLPVTDLTAIVL